MVSSG
jgi:hypothetical protein